MNKFLKDLIKSMPIKEKIDLLMEIHEEQIAGHLLGDNFKKDYPYQDRKPWEDRKWDRDDKKPWKKDDNRDIKRADKIEKIEKTEKVDIKPNEQIIP